MAAASFVDRTDLVCCLVHVGLPNANDVDLVVVHVYKSDLAQYLVVLYS